MPGSRLVWLRESNYYMYMYMYACDLYQIDDKICHEEI